MAWAIFIVVLAAIGWIWAGINMIVQSYAAAGAMFVIFSLVVFPWLIRKLIKEGKGGVYSPPQTQNKVSDHSQSRSQTGGVSYDLPKNDGVHLSQADRSIPSVFGGMDYYDKNGKKVGHSVPGIFGDYDIYDEKGHKTGYSMPGIFGGYDHYDSHGHKTGYSMPGVFGGWEHYDAKGKKIASSDENLFGGYHKRK